MTGPVGGWVKRAFDVAVASTALFLSAPVLLLICIAIKLADGGSPFFGHMRIGYDGREFRCWKLRTMRVDGDALLAAHFAASPDAEREWTQTRKLKNDPRVTSIGRFLRVSSIDELPQLINIVLGEMSIVGPRPVTRSELARYGSCAEHYLRSRPGLTGLWQVSGRSNLSYDARVKLDSRYVKTWSLARDISIVVRTVPALVQAKGSC